MQLNWRPKPSQSYNCRLIYRVPNTYYAETEWHDVRFSLPMFERPIVRTAVLYLFLVLAATGLFQITFIRLSVRRWLPLLVGAFASGGSVSSRAIQALNVDGQLLVILVGCTFLAALSIGMLSPKAFRYVTNFEPHLLVPLALASGRLRKRLYGGHITATIRQIKLQRDKLGGEYYTSMPCGQLLPSGKESSTVMQPIQHILTTEERQHILITGPGGRGKSALLRELTLAACARYEADSSASIPVFASAASGNVVDLVAKSLGASAFPPDVLVAQLLAGHFMLLIDGLTEGGVDAPILAAFLQSVAGNNTSVVCSARPSDLYQEAFWESPVGSIIIPRMLDDSTVVEFQNTYINGDRANGINSSLLSDMRKKVCRSSEGNFFADIGSSMHATAGRYF